MARLGINVDHVATVREARKINEPDPVAAAILAELGGADQITVHLREDRRHIQDRDVDILRKVVRTRLNLEMAATDEMVAIALAIRPDMVTLVPEKRQEITTEGGLDVIREANKLEAQIRTLKSGRIIVNMFIDPELEQVKMSSKLGADGVELHTGTYADSYDTSEYESELDRIANAANMANKLNLITAAGHGLTYQNVSNVVRIRQIEEFNIGHTIISRAILVGIERAVKEMARLVKGY